MIAREAAVPGAMSGGPGKTRRAFRGEQPDEGGSYRFEFRLLEAERASDCGPVILHA